MTFVNIISQTVHVFGFIRLGRMPKIRKGSEAMPRNGTGRRSCCQQPLQILDRSADITMPSLIRPHTILGGMGAVRPTLLHSYRPNRVGRLRPSRETTIKTAGSTQ